MGGVRGSDGRRKRSARRWYAIWTVQAVLAALVVVIPATAVVAEPVPATYVAQGPRPINGGQVENVTPNNEVSGAVHTVVAHPTDANILWIGSVNGGLWRTNNATAASPTWTPLDDQLPSLSIGALELDPTVASNTVLVAAVGRFSSFGRIGGPRVGIYRTADTGTTWTNLGAVDLAGENLSGVAPRGNVIVVSSNGNTNFGGAGLGGIFRSTDTGANFTRLSGNGTSGLPNQGVFDLVGDSSDTTRLYAATQTGIFRSDDTGATWNNVTNQVVISAAATNNIELAVHNTAGNNVVYAGVINNGQLAGLWRSTNQGGAWTAMDIPQTNEGGTIIGIQPREKPGSQGGVHFSILADNGNANVVYLGGDRQPLGAGNSWPNSIGASDFSGRLFRCDASLAAGTQCTSLTHNGTANNSSPHADSREAVFDAGGDMIEVDDGGVYRRTSPQDANGDWFSLNGNLQISEHHDCDYDSVGNLILCGNQDTGAPEQTASGATVWTTLSAGDGGFVAVNDSGALSVRFSSSNNLGANSFRRRICDNTNSCINSAPGFVVNGTGGQTIQQVEVNAAGNSTLPLYTPLFMNTIDPARFIVTSNTVYESPDSLDTFNIIVNSLGVLPNGNNARSTRAIAYGGRAGGANNADVLWLGTNNGQLLLRTAAGGTPTQLPAWTNGNASDIVLDPENWARAFVSVGASVFVTDDAGASFTNITGDLGSVAPNANVRSLEVVEVPGTSELAILAGVDTGVFLTQTQNLGAWVELGADLPNVIAYDLHNDTNDDVLLVATMGRGAWLVNNISAVIPIADLSVSKSAAPNPVIAGEELFYTITVTNGGPDTAFATVLTDTLPDEVIYLENDAGCTYDQLAHELTCELGDLASGESATFTVKTLVKSDAVVNEDDGTLLITNEASVIAVSVDPDLSNNTITESTFVQEEADLEVTKVCKPDDELLAGEIGTCTIFIDNRGPSSAREVVVTDTNLSDGAFSFGTITPSQGTCSAPVDGVVTCDLGSLEAASATETGRATVEVEVTATEDVDINDVATVVAATPDPDTSNNAAEGSISVMAVSDLTIDKTGPATAIAGTDITYNITIQNDGPSTATGVVVEDVLSTGVSILSVTGSGGAACNAGTPGNPELPTTCSFGTLSPGASRTMTIDVHVLADTRGEVHNDARVDSTTFDDDLSDNLDTVVTIVTGEADVSITKSDSPDPVLAGNDLTYTVIVSNAGPSTADDVTVTDTLPAGTAFVQGVDGNDTPICTFVAPDQTVCELGTMDPGTSVNIFITATVDPAVPDGTVLTNNASVTSSTPDPDPSNNSDSESTTVETSAELWLDKTGERVSGNPSHVVIYTLVVHNDPGCEEDAQSSPTPTCGQGGPSDAQGVTVVDTLPLTPKKVVVQFVSPECVYDTPSHTVTCSAGPLPAGETVTFVIEVKVNGSVRLITNTATLSATTFDPVLDNNTDSADIIMKGGTGKGKNS